MHLVKIDVTKIAEVVSENDACLQNNKLNAADGGNSLKSNACPFTFDKSTKCSSEDGGQSPL